MSRTPEKITDKKAENTKSSLYGFGFLAGLFAWAAFSEGQTGEGLVAALICLAFFAIAGQIKTTYHKEAEASVYKKR